MITSLASLSEDLLQIVQRVPLKCGENSENPWGQSMQAAAPGADEIQLPDVDLRDPLDHYRQLRMLWAVSLRSKRDTYSASLERILRHPLGKTFQPSVAISQLLMKSQPLAPVQFDSGAALAETGLSWQEGRVPLLPETCQLALLWALNGEFEASQRLVKWLLPFLELKTLWASERRYDEGEFYLSAYLLLSYAGFPEKAAAFLSEGKKSIAAKRRLIDPFFLELENQINKIYREQEGVTHYDRARHSQIDLSEKRHSQLVKGDEAAETREAKLRSAEQLSVCESAQRDRLGEVGDGSLTPELGTWTFAQGELRGAITLSGYGTSLGVFQKRTVEIRALGPQFYPLTDARGFGLKGIHASQKMDRSAIRGWTRCLAQNEVWMEVAAEGTKLDVQFMGLVPEKKMAFVFYVSADSAQIDTNVFRPKSLQRYSGFAKSAQFGNLSLECPVPRKMELIPLAGEGCFWGSDFLLAFEMNPFEPTGSFHLI